MVFWIAVGVGALFIWIAIQIGFYATWTMFFNLVLSAYVALFLTPVVITSVPAATETPYGYALVLMCVAIATLLIAYGLTFACLSGQLRAYFPKAFDSVGAGFLGFLTGFLVWSFVAFAFAITPLSHMEPCKSLGFEPQAQLTNTGYVCFWCNRMHGILGYSNSELRDSQQAVQYLKNKASPPPVKAIVPEAEGTTPVAPEGDAAAAPPAPPAPPGLNAPPAAPAETTSPFAPVSDKSAPAAAPASAPGPAYPAGAAQPKQDAAPKSAGAVEGPAQPNGKAATVEKSPFSVERPASSPLGDGPMSGVWQTPAGARFRISDDKKGITVEGGSDVLQSLNGKLTRAGGRPEEKVLTGTFDAVFSYDARTYVIDVTMTLVNPNTLSIRCTNWPKWNNKGKLLGKDVLSITWLRVPDAMLDSPASAEGQAAPAP
jgi:hypothetical protein